MTTFESIYNKLILENSLLPGSSGCSDTEVSNLEDKYGLSLPSSYKCFLKLCGRYCTAFDENEFYYQFRFVECMTEQLILDRKEIMEEKGEQCAEFPKNIFFILDRYGEEYNYILANGGGDSAVYYYNYPEDTFKKVFDSIGEWFEAHVADMKSFRDQQKL